MIDGYVYKQTAINAICQDWCGTSNADCKNQFNPEKDEYYHCDGCGDVELIKALPSADVVNKTDLLGWLLAYHTKSFELKGRYPSHEVISWLVNDLSMYLFEDGEQND